MTLEQMKLVKKESGYGATSYETGKGYVITVYVGGYAKEIYEYDDYLKVMEELS